jgi:hypothetical protein
MYIEINLSVAPPVTTLREPNDFNSFKITVRKADHAQVTVESLEQLAGDRADDPEWRRGFEKMLEYARVRGWVHDGVVRAHIEWLS